MFAVVCAVNSLIYQTQANVEEPKKIVENTARNYSLRETYSDTTSGNTSDKPSIWQSGEKSFSFVYRSKFRQILGQKMHKIVDKSVGKSFYLITHIPSGLAQ